jgi:hypothetical protein
MKHQYFGDENDYRKYGLLRALSGNGRLSTGVWWMRTEDDGSSDGKFTSYLASGAARRHDPLLFDHLRSALATGRRHLDHVEKSDILPNSRFFSEIVPDKREARVAHTRRMMEVLGDTDLLVVDPDNGVEVKSKPVGSKGSSKFVQWSEIEGAYRAGQSVLVYQHFPRQARVSYTSAIANAMGVRTGVRRIDTFATTRVLFILARQETHVAVLEAGVRSIAARWGGQLRHQSHEVA